MKNFSIKPGIEASRSAKIDLVGRAIKDQSELQCSVGALWPPCLGYVHTPRRNAPQNHYRCALNSNWHVRQLEIGDKFQPRPTHTFSSSQMSLVNEVFEAHTDTHTHTRDWKAIANKPLLTHCRHVSPFHYTSVGGSCFGSPDP